MRILRWLRSLFTVRRVVFPSQRQFDANNRRLITEGFLGGFAWCKSCLHSWRCLIHPDADQKALECPECHRMKGQFIPRICDECGYPDVRLISGGTYCSVCGFRLLK